MAFNQWNVDHLPTTRRCSAKAYEEAGIRNPREEISMMEVHDCFSIAEMVTTEDLHISEKGKAWKDFLDGFYNLDGQGIPCQPDGGLKCFGHPIGASGLRMVYEMYLQLHGRAGERQIENPRYGLTHNLGGFPFLNVISISIVGKYEN
jgi:acetyl-CoA C-acetyltransferase